jgi:uncharacterized protein YraI
MVRKTVPLLIGLLVLAGLAQPGFSPAAAQTGPDAYTNYQLNLRTGAGQHYPAITILAPGAGMTFEARNADMSWLLGHTEDGAYRGWVASLYLRFREGFSAARLPVSDEVIAYQPAAAPSAQGVEPPAEGIPASGAPPALAAVPIVPAISANVRDIFLRGQALGNDPRGITKVGECNSMSHAFLHPFGAGEYNLGPYGYLQAAISFFPASAFTHESVAARAGLTSQAALDAAWADPNLCPGGISLLECEYARSKPSIAFVMLGLQDVYFLGAQQYEQAMRRIIEISIDRGVIPVLTTMPVLPGDYAPRDAARIDFNMILVNLAREYHIPLMNLWLATESVAQHGIGVDFVHLSERGDNWTDFNGEETQWGFTMWNLVALQTLDQLRAALSN